MYTYLYIYLCIYIYVYMFMYTPIIPLIVYGAYELYPVNNWVNTTGNHMYLSVYLYSYFYLYDLYIHAYI
jgi:hypothetical protein